MIYSINIKAHIKSNLSQNKLENQLVVALHDVDNQYSKFDGVDGSLKVIDYEYTKAKEICPHCEADLVSKVFDIDGTNLEDCGVCEGRNYGMSALR